MAYKLFGEVEWLWSWNAASKEYRFYGLGLGTFMIGVVVAMREADGSMRKGY